MKSKLLRLVSLACIAILALSGCSTFKKNSTTPPPVATPSQAPTATTSATTSPQFTPVNGQASSIAGQNQVPNPRFSRRPNFVNYTMFNNVFDVRSQVYSDASVLITNHEEKDGVIQISDNVLGMPDGLGRLAVIVVPPGQSFSLKDFGFGPLTQVRFLFLDDNDEPDTYAWTPVRWPLRGGRQIGGEMIWNIQKGDAIPLPKGPTHTKLPMSASRTASVGPTVLTSQPGPTASPAGSTSSATAPAAPAGTPPPALTPTTP